MPKASDVKRGNVIEIDDELYVVRNVDVRSPSSRGAATLYKLTLSNVQTGLKREESCKGDDFLKEGELIKRSVQFSYREGDMITFMDTEDYSQYTLNEDAVAEQAGYLSEDLEGVIALLVDGNIIGIELPQTVVLQVTDTAPGIKGGSATARTKPATLSTGMEVQVPEYLEPGERIKINTATGKFMSRA